jgi:putative copper export protein/mono/diheme cytochrome c family protein
VTEILLLLSRVLHYAATVGLEGTLGFTVFVARPAALENIYRRWLWACLGLALVSGFFWFLALASGMSGRSLAGAFDPHILGIVLLKTRFGELFLLRLALAGLTALTLLLPQRRFRVPALMLAAALLGSLAWAGHGADDAGADGAFHLSADIVHLLTAGAWIGGLPPLALLFHRAIQSGTSEWMEIARRAAGRFSILGIAAVGLLLASGIVNASYLVSSLAGFFGTGYGQLLLVKIALFGALIALATVNREVLTPRLSSVPRGAKQRASSLALRSLRRNSLIEAGLGLGVLSIVAWLGTMVPAAHQQPLWPFPFRIDTAVLSAPQYRGAAWLALGSAALGVALGFASFVFRKLWGVVVVAWLLIIAFFLPGLSLLTQPAFPTSFFQSPSGFTTGTIALGQQAFARNCVSCHGTGGRGDGPLAGQLADPPADLAADHIYAHSDGDLFWYIAHGISGTPMPGFSPQLNDADIWNLIDFIHANADGVRAAQATPAQAPDFAIECPDGTVTSLRQLGGPIVHLVFAGPRSAARLAALSRLDPGGGAVTVIADLGAPSSAVKPFCRAAEAGMAQAYALYPPGRGDDILGDEFLIDSRGWLRGVWLPRAGAGWGDDKTLQQDIAEIRANPILVSPRPTGHVHG